MLTLKIKAKVVISPNSLVGDALDSEVGIAALGKARAASAACFLQAPAPAALFPENCSASGSAAIFFASADQF